MSDKARRMIVVVTYVMLMVIALWAAVKLGGLLVDLIANGEEGSGL